MIAQHLFYLAFVLLFSVILARVMKVETWPPLLVVVTASALGVCLIGLWKLIGE